MDDVFTKIGSDSTLSQVIERKIEEAICKKKFSSGQRLPSEMELCSMFGVSRTALREALRMLSARGLIEVKKGSGIFVNDFSSHHASRPMSLYLELNFDKSYILHVIQVRRMLEPQIARLAAEHRTETDLYHLEKNMGELIECDPSDAMLEANLDLEFHSRIAKASENPIIPVILDPIFSLMPKIKAMVIAHIENAKSAAVEYHQKIYEMIKAQDGQKAFDAMTEHLKIAEEHNLKLLKSIDQNEVE